MSTTEINADAKAAQLPAAVATEGGDGQVHVCAVSAAELIATLRFELEAAHDTIAALRHQHQSLCMELHEDDPYDFRETERCPSWWKARSARTAWRCSRRCRT
jgi:hypothetical protein